MDEVRYTPIGVVRSPFAGPHGVPIQPSASDARGTVEVLPQYHECLRDLGGFSHAILLVHFHKVRGFEPTCVPFLDDLPRGVFATRSPRRPNPIGLSVVRILGVRDGTLYVEGLDLLDGTPVLDIKPYVPRFDDGEGVKIGWLEGRIEGLGRARDDGRFTG